MSFINQNNCLINDSIGNIYNFSWSEHGINLSIFYKATGQVNSKTLIEDSIDEYDVTIDEKDVIYLTCQKKDGNILLLYYDNDVWNESVIAEAFDSRVYNLNVISINNTLHILYCVSSNENPNVLKIFHHYLNDNSWITHEVEEIGKREILNPFQVICANEEIILGYYNLAGNSEEIFIKKFSTNFNRWGNSIKLTSGRTIKLYIDLLMTDDNCINLVYSEYQNENLIIKYEKHKLLDDISTKVCENLLSNPANCTYPTLIHSQGALWNMWVEYDSIVSCFSDDNGSSWSLPYMWTESKNNNFTRYKFMSKDKQINNNHVLNHSFGLLGSEISFIGFGNIENAIEMPLKFKKKERIFEYKETLNRNQIKVIKDKGDAEMEKEIADLKKNIQSLEDNIKSIEKRVDEIETFIFRRRRSNSLFGPRD